MSASGIEKWRKRAPFLVAAGWLAPATLATLDAYAQAKLDHRPPLGAREYLWSGGDWFLYALLTPLVFALARRFPLSRPRLARNLLIQLLFSVAFCGLWSGSGCILRWILFPAQPPDRGFVVSWFFTTLPFGVAVYFAMAAVAMALDVFVESRRREIEAAQLNAQLAEARLSALRMQLNPHFLLNSLNAVAVLVRDGDAAAAGQTIERLGEILHRVLASSTRAECRLEEELAFLRQYLEIERIRFSDRLRFEFEVEAGLEDATVPTLILQPLVENALRHGIAQSAEGGTVVVSTKRNGDVLVLAVEDDGAGPPAAWSEGLGIRASKARGAFRLTRKDGVTRAEIRLRLRKDTDGNSGDYRG